MLLEEARTTTSQQLGQINKNEVAAVRTVKISFLLLGLLAGGSQLPPFPDLGLPGVLGTWALVGSLLASLFVYGEAETFIGPRPDELSIDYTGEEDSTDSYAEVLNRYEDGILRNQRVLYSNGFLLGISRLLLALAIVFVVLGFTSRFTAPLLRLSTFGWLTNVY